MCVNRFVAAFAVALTAVVSHARETPIYEGRLASPLNANQQMITNLPSAFWEGHGVGGVDTNAVKALINSETGGTNAVKTAVQPGAATNIAEAVVGAWTPAAISDGTNRIDASGVKVTNVPYVDWHVTYNPNGFEGEVGVAFDDVNPFHTGELGWYLHNRFDYVGETLLSTDPNETELVDLHFSFNSQPYPIGLSRSFAHTVTNRLATTNELPTAAQKAAWDAKASPEQLYAVQTNAYTKSEADAAFAPTSTAVTVTSHSSQLSQLSQSLATKIDAHVATNAAEAVFSENADYRLTPLPSQAADPAQVSLTSGVIASLVAPSNVVVSLTFGADSGDCLLWLEASAEGAITVSGYNARGLADDFLKVSAGTNLVMFTKVNTNTVIVTSKEVKQ